jgi:hypothetical protein
MPKSWTQTDWRTQGPRVLELKKAGKTFKDIGAIIGVHHETVRAWFNKHGKGEILPGDMTLTQEAPQSAAVEVLAGQMRLDEPDIKAESEDDHVSAVADISPVSELSEPLSPAEVQTLEHYEEIIALGIKTFVLVGHALLTIRDRRLYRGAYSTFEDYCRQRWDLSRPYAYQLMEASAVVENVSAIADIVPVNEAQARPLTTLPAEQQREVWREAVETAPPSGITAKHVQVTVKRAKGRLKTAGELAEEEVAKTPPMTFPKESAEAEWIRQFDQRCVRIHEFLGEARKSGGIALFIQNWEPRNQSDFLSRASHWAKYLDGLCQTLVLQW